jgi:amidase
MQQSLSQSLSSYDATALAEAIATGKLSSMEVVRAHLELIERLNGKYNALVTLDRRRALRRAKEADEALARGECWGPLHGVPITVKDSFETEGLRTTAGFEALEKHVPEKDAAAVRKLKAAGAIVLGKTNCARLCCDIQTRNPLFGTTNNPYDVDRTCGGSSGGEAAAVALGMSPLGIGSDTGGSIRIPSSYCGVFGLKTSVGRISTEGLLPTLATARSRPDSLTVVGPIARSVRDLMLCYRVLADETAQEPAAPRRPRIFWSAGIGGLPVDDDVSELFAARMLALSKRNVDLVKVDAPEAVKDTAAAYIRLSMFEFAPKENNRKFHFLFWGAERFASLFRGGLKARYATLKAEQRARAARMAQFMGGCDAWVLPATPTVAFRHCRRGEPIPVTVEGRRQACSYFGASQGHAYPINLLGNPSVVLPLGYNREGLPIAIQVVGKPGEDMKLLAIASDLALHLGCHDLALGRDRASARRLARVRVPRMDEPLTVE